MYGDIKITTRTTDGVHALEGESSRIVCPQCGMEQVHLRDVEVGARKEDRPARVFLIGMQSGEARQAHRPEDKCIGRRDWLKLIFDCEGGCVFTLVLAQHKGDTFVNVMADDLFTRIDKP